MSKALVLAGGGARGSYHIGAWEALMELGYKPDIVTGTSVGCMNATLIALDRFDDAKALWLALNENDVLAMPEGVTARDTLRLAKNIVTSGGLDISPMATMLARFTNEEALRNADCKIGLVTINVNTLKPLELTLDEIPEGKLIDYILASGACFPFLKPKDIDGQMFIDGGYFDNIPANLAAKMGATEIVEIALNGVGKSRPLSKKYSHIKPIKVKCYHDLGSILVFSPELAKRNMELGYLDTQKAFGKLEGLAFAFKLGEIDRMMTAFGAAFLKLYGTVAHLHPTIFLSNKLYFTKDRANPRTNKDKFLAILENAMMSANLPLGDIYNCERVIELLRDVTDTHASERFELLLEDTVASRLIAPLAATNLAGLSLALVRQVL